MNYEKKRKRQNGRQRINESERQIIYRQAYYDGQAEIIERMINAGVLPPVSYDLKSVSIPVMDRVSF